MTDQLKIVRTLVNKKELSEQDITEIERIHALYQAASALATDRKLRLPPHSRVKVDLPSFCLDPSGTIPSQHEPFLWKKEDPGVPYYSKIIQLVSRDASIAQKDIQELIWNLKNKTNYEDYPLRLRRVLEQVDPKAKVVLPSRIKGTLQDAAGNMIRDAIPELDAAGDVLSLIEGRYYSYSEIAESLERRTPHKSAPPRESDLSRLESQPGVYASVQSSGFSKQKAVLFNTNGRVVGIDLSEYFLKPIHTGVQRIGLSTSASLGHALISVIEAALKDAIIRNSEYWYAGRLTPAEMAFIKHHPIEALNAYAQSRKAILSTWKHFGRNSDGDESDAFRHFVWAGWLAQQLGDKMSGEFLSAHEQLPSNAKQEDRLSSEMDQRNNAEGLRSAKVLLDRGDFSPSRLEKVAYDALIQGRLKVLQPQGNGLIYPVN